MLTTLCILLLSVRVFAPADNSLPVLQANPINYYDRLITAVLEIESQGDNYALNVIEQAHGPLQIRPIRLNDYNKRTGSHYLPGDCFDYELSRKIFLYYTKGRSYEAVAKSWNGSGRMTIEYWKKVQAKL